MGPCPIMADGRLPGDSGRSEADDGEKNEQRRRCSIDNPTDVNGKRPIRTHRGDRRAAARGTTTKTTTRDTSADTKDTRRQEVLEFQRQRTPRVFLTVVFLVLLGVLVVVPSSYGTVPWSLSRHSSSGVSLSVIGQGTFAAATWETVYHQDTKEHQDTRIQEVLEF